MEMPCQLIVYNSACQIVPRLHPDVLGELDDMLAFGIEGAKYTAQFVNKTWDGRKHLFSVKKQSFPTGYMLDVLGKLKELGIEPEIVDKRVVPAMDHAIVPLTMDPWDHQKKVFEVCAGNPRGLIQVATGGGKSLCIAGVWGMLNVPGVLLVFRKELLYQLHAHISKYLGTKIGIFGDGVWLPGDVPFTVCMAQSLMKVAGPQYTRYLREFEEGDEKTDDIILKRKMELHKTLIQDTQFVAIDESHRAGANAAYAVLQAMNNAYWRYGFSATAFGFREDKKDFLIKAAIGDVLIKVSTTDLVNIGHLVPTDVIEVEYSHKGKHYPRESYAEYYDKAVSQNDDRNRIIVELAYGLFRKGRNVLIAVQRVDHGKLLEEYLQYLVGKDNAKFVYGEDDRDYRKEHLGAFSDRRLPILISTLVGEGWDVQWMDTIINVRGEESRIATIQLMGRGMRKFPGKKKAAYFDIMDKGTTWLSRHTKVRETIYSGEPVFKRMQIRPGQVKGFVDGYV